jgi:hypothetical protein
MPAQIGGLLTRIPRQATASQFRDAHFQQVRDVKGRFGGGWGFAWVGLASTADNIKELNDHLHESVRDAAESLKDEMVSYAQNNYEWTPREEGTRGRDEELPHAHEAIQGGVVWEDEEHFTIFLGHGKDIYYGIWLEVRWGGRYAIILPTIMQFAPQLGGRIRTLA